MKIHIIGNEGWWHCGSKAVTQYLYLLVEKHGFTLVDNGSDADCVLINGEGSLHDNLRLDKLALGFLFKSEGKKVHLINSVWQNMNLSSVEVIKDFDSVFVREIISYNEIKSIRPDAKIVTDLSYFLPTVDPVMSRSETIVGGFFNTDVGGDFGWLEKTKGYRRVNIKSYDLWQNYLNDLAPAKLLITGFHHEVIAAIKLRIPFVAYRGNTDKVLGIIRRAEANIPVAAKPSELLHNMDNLPPQEEYDKLFDFIAAEKPFDLGDLS
jgi:hypothetical protein